MFLKPREIPSPTSIDCEDMVLMANGKAEPQVQLTFLILKKADIKIAHRKKSDKEEKRKPSFQTRNPPRPSLLREPSFHSNPISNNHAESRSMPTSALFNNFTKGGPIKELTARVKATSLFSSRLGRNHKNS
jgi:hypothetical protein